MLTQKSLNNLDEYPKEAVALGTFVRANRFNRLGVVTDAFYGDQDEDGTELIIYTVLMFPVADLISKQNSSSDKYYVSNEYEYEITAYLMIGPVDIKKLNKSLNGGMYF